MRNKKIFPLLLAAVALSVAACSSSNSRGEAAPELLGIDSLPPDIQNLVRAVAKNDTLSFAAAVSYPLQRPYPLRDIATDSAMRTYYGVLMDDSLRNVIIDNPGKSWVDCGWRGWSAGDGNYIWFDGGIYAIPYMSKRETAMRDSLVRVEMASLYKPMRRGWQPVACYRGVGNDSVFRIDMRQPANKAPQFRLAAYASPAGLRNRPAAEYLGYRTVDGSAMIETYTFVARDAAGKAVTTVTFTPDFADVEGYSSISVDRAGGKGRTIRVVPAYWLDLLRPAAPPSAK
ncbi:MAG: hypothetical protein MRZ32_09460 [Bacteroidales bacterium]|nr:hypothetical protein [Bacteroidales bacterium]MDY2916516.1 hypothetical protein [Muribaculaceae bacterium]